MGVACMEVASRLLVMQSRRWLATPPQTSMKSWWHCCWTRSRHAYRREGEEGQALSRGLKAWQKACCHVSCLRGGKNRFTFRAGDSRRLRRKQSWTVVTIAENAEEPRTRRNTLQQPQQAAAAPGGVA